MARLPKALIRQYGITKKAWQVHRANQARKKGSKAKRGGRKVAGKRAKARATASRAMFGPEMNYLLGTIGSYVGEELEVKQIRPRVEAASGARTQMNVGLEGVVDLGIGFAANYLGNRMPKGRSFLKGLAYSIGGKGVGKVKHAATGKPGFLELFVPK